MYTTTDVLSREGDQNEGDAAPGRSARVDIEGPRAAGPQRSQRPVRVTIRAPLEFHRAVDAERAKADLPTMSMSPARVCNVRRQ